MSTSKMRPGAHPWLGWSLRETCDMVVQCRARLARLTYVQEETTTIGLPKQEKPMSFSWRMEVKQDTAQSTPTRSESTMLDGKPQHIVTQWKLFIIPSGCCKVKSKVLKYKQGSGFKNHFIKRQLSHKQRKNKT
eukprot:753601-Hanusia_phi.AAC.1